MTGPPTSEIAGEVDRLVIGVHRAVMARHRSRLGDLAGSVDVVSPGHLYDLAEFLAAGACTPEIARRRFRYDADDTAGALVDGLRERGLVDGEGRPVGALADVVDTMLRWRADAAEDLWGSDLGAATRRAAEALARGSGPLVEVFRSLPEPARAAHRLHHLLTGLRYARFEAHLAAWERAELTAAEIVALSSAVAAMVMSRPPGRLVARGWLTEEGSATVEGHAARTAIEAETDARCDAVYGSATARLDLLDSLPSLPVDADE